MEFAPNDRVIINPSRVKSSAISELESSIVLCFTGRTRASADIIEQQVRNVASDDKKARDGMIALRQEAIDMKEAILKGDMRNIGTAMNRGWLAKQSTASGVSTSHIDAVIDAAFACGAYAGRVSGAGGGGFILFLADPQQRREVVRVLTDLRWLIFSCHFTAHGVESWRW
jgi:D-glycero-alpha-D-manno-heptose-7-phosphate kinase